MKVLIIGANGMLGGDLMDVCRTSGLQAEGFDLPEVDITDYNKLIDQLPAAHWIVNCAAFTRVDDAEKERDAAFAVNSTGVRNLARISVARQVPVLHISTDYVFDGRAGRPYDEIDRTNPLNIYGASKLAGEKLLRGEGGAFLIVRTQSLFGKRGANFVKAIANKLKTSTEPLKVVDDQISAPTYTRHLAEALVRLMQIQARGMVHVTASESCTWYEFARTITELVKPGHEILPVSTKDLSRPAMRPMYSLLNNTRYQHMTGHVMPSWREGLNTYLQEEELLK